MVNTREFIEKLVALGERQLQNEDKATELLTAFLRNAGIEHAIQTFGIKVPVTQSAVLTVDGISVPCAGT